MCKKTTAGHGDTLSLMPVCCEGSGKLCSSYEKLHPTSNIRTVRTQAVASTCYSHAKNDENRGANTSLHLFNTRREERHGGQPAATNSKHTHTHGRVVAFELSNSRTRLYFSLFCLSWFRQYFKIKITQVGKVGCRNRSMGKHLRILFTKSAKYVHRMYTSSKSPNMTIRATQISGAQFMCYARFDFPTHR